MGLQAWGVKPERKPAVQLVPEQMVALAAEIEPTGRATCRRSVSQSPPHCHTPVPHCHPPPAGGHQVLNHL